jgi:hypothetical protein
MTGQEKYDLSIEVSDMKFSMTGQEKGDLSIQVTPWAGLTTCIFVISS